MSESNDKVRKSLAEQLLGGVREDLGAIWAEQLSPAEQELIADVCGDAAALQIEALILPDDELSRNYLATERRHVEAQLANIRAVAAERVRLAIWKTANKVIGKLVRFAVDAI